MASGQEWLWLLSMQDSRPFCFLPRDDATRKKWRHRSPQPYLLTALCAWHQKIKTCSAETLRDSCSTALPFITAASPTLPAPTGSNRLAKQGSSMSSSPPPASRRGSISPFVPSWSLRPATEMRASNANSAPTSCCRCLAEPDEEALMSGALFSLRLICPAFWTHPLANSDG